MCLLIIIELMNEIGQASGHAHERLEEDERLIASSGQSE
jgi:hypothetical protein